jgi:hypothetical protein
MLYPRKNSPLIIGLIWLSVTGTAMYSITVISTKNSLSRIFGVLLSFGMNIHGVWIGDWIY